MPVHASDSWGAFATLLEAKSRVKATGSPQEEPGYHRGNMLQRVSTDDGVDCLKLRVRRGDVRNTVMVFRLRL